MYSTSIAVTSSTNPSTYGGSVMLSAKVSPSGGPPYPSMTGTVEFFSNNISIGTGTVTWFGSPNNFGMAQLTVSSLHGGSNAITATYFGDGNFSLSTTTSALSQVVNKATEHPTVTGSVPSVYGQLVTVSAHVSNAGGSSANPTGTVDFYDSGTLIGSGTLSSGMGGFFVALFPTSALSVGSHSISATYLGDNNYASASTSSPTSFTVNKANTSVSLSSSANPSALCQSVTFTAVVTATNPGSGVPTGTVTFKNGATTMGTGTLSGGVATYSTSSLTQGSATITADYGGDSNFNSSNSSSLAQTISAAVNWVLNASALSPDSQQGVFLDYGSASASPLTGALIQSLSVDPNQHETCDCGCGCSADNCQAGTIPLSLVYNSETVNALPVIQATLASELGRPADFPSSLTLQR